MRVLALDRATAEAIERLGGAGIRSLLLKGPALSRWIYPDESDRPYTDADLMVEPGFVEGAERILAALGFQRMGLDTLPVDRPRYAVTLRRADDGLAIDLHRRLVGIGAGETDVWAAFTEGTETIDVAGTRVEILAPPSRALVLALHAAKDGARSPRVIVDMERALDVVPEDVWREAAALATRLDAVPGLVSGLRRVERGTVLAARLDLPDAVSAEFVLREERPPPMTVGAKWLLEERGIRHRAQVVAHKLFPTPEFMHAWHPLARRGPVGLALAYTWRPLWVLWHAVPAIRAVRRARRTAARGNP